MAPDSYRNLRALWILADVLVSIQPIDSSMSSIIDKSKFSKVSFRADKEVMMIESRVAMLQNEEKRL
jgi:hypothetical protein